MAEETKRQRYEALRGQLKRERDSFLPHWRDLSEFILPRRSRFLTSERNKGDKRNQKIIDSTGTLAARTLRSGMHSGVTSPARPWKRISTPDPDLAEFGPVKEWLHVVDQRMNTVFLRSNLYNALPLLYGDMGVFGTACMAVLEDPDKLLRCYPFPIGSYMLANDSRLIVDTCVREFEMTVRQIVTKFGDPLAGPGKRWATFSSTVRNMWDRGQYEQWVKVVHLVRPNVEADPRKLEARFKPFLSCYYEEAGDAEIFLRESGFDENAILAPRWDVTGEDVYGYSPGMDALGDVKALQLMHRRKAEAIEKGVRPSLTAPTSMRNQKVSQIPGDVTYVDVREGQQGIRPTHEVRLNLADLGADIQEHQYRVRRAFYEDLFLLIANDTRSNITATEIAERKEEKLLALGPVMERLNDELLDPLIDRTFGIMLRRGMIPPPPKEIAEQELKVEYISIMAQAQKLVGAGGLERFAGFVGNLAGVNPEVLDKFDMDQAADEYGDMMGVSPRIVRTDEQVGQIRQGRQQAAAAQQQAAMLEQQAKGAKLLSETDVESDNALTRLIGAGVI